QPIDPHAQVGAGRRHRAGALGTGGGSWRTALARAEPLAAAEDAVEQSGPLALLRPGGAGRDPSHGRGRGQRRDGEHASGRRAKDQACHGYLGVVWAPKYHTNSCVQIVTAGPFSRFLGPRCDRPATAPECPPTRAFSASSAIPRNAAPRRRTPARTAPPGRS